MRYIFSSWNLVSSTNRIKTYRATYSQQTLYIWNKYSVSYQKTSDSDQTYSRGTPWYNQFGFIGGSIYNPGVATLIAPYSSLIINDDGKFTLNSNTPSRSDWSNGTWVCSTSNWNTAELVMFMANPIYPIKGTDNDINNFFCNQSVSIIDIIANKVLHIIVDNRDDPTTITFRLESIQLNKVFISDVVSTSSSTYPYDDKHTDGYWYTRR